MKKIDYEIYKKTLLLAVPIMIQNGITNAVGLVDNLMVGSLGTEAMTAVSISGQLIFVFNLALFGALSGPGIFGAQYFGKGDIEGVKNVFRIKLWAAIAIGIIGILVFLNFDGFLIGRYMTGNAEGIDAVLTMNYAKTYLHIMLIGFPLNCITQVYATSLRETNESLSPMVAGVISVVADVVFNYLLIYGKFGFPRLGVSGAAYATVIARLAEFVVLIVWTHIAAKKRVFVKGLYKTLLVPKKIIWPIFKKSLPILVNEFLWAGAIAAMTQCYSARGLNVIAGLNISNAICNLLNVVFIALGHAVGIIIGQMLGAGELDRAKKSSVSLMWFSAFICAFLTVILIILAPIFPNAYETSSDVKAYARTFITVTAIFFPLQGFLNSLYFTLRSGGKTLITFVFDSMFSWVVGVGTAFVLSHFTNLSIVGIYIAVQLTDIIKVTIGYIMIKKGIWMSNIVNEY